MTYGDDNTGQGGNEEGSQLHFDCVSKRSDCGGNVTRVTKFLLSNFSIGEAQRRGGRSTQEVQVTSAHNEYL